MASRVFYGWDFLEAVAARLVLPWARGMQYHWERGCLATENAPYISIDLGSGYLVAPHAAFSATNEGFGTGTYMHDQTWASEDREECIQQAANWLNVKIAPFGTHADAIATQIRALNHSTADNKDEEAG